MTTTREQAMTALLDTLVGALAASFTATTDGTSAVLTSVSSTANLYVGLPVFGTGVQAGATIDSFDPVAATVTLSLPTTAAGSGVGFTSGFQTTGRRLKFWTDPITFPALFLRNVSDKFERREKQPPRRIMQVEAWIYSKAGANPDIAPGVALNNILDALETALAPDNVLDNRMTLGGLVYHCWIEGESLYDPGDIGDIAKAMVPIHILIP